MIRIAAALTCGLLLTACGKGPVDLEKPAEPLGDFELGFAEVVAPNVQKLLISRDVPTDELIASVDAAVEERFRRYEGGKLYHFGISVEAYSLPPALVPGKSALALRVTIWDDAKAAKMNDETHLLHVIKVFESRISTNRDAQLKALSQDAALEIEKWLREQQEAVGWFGPVEVDEPTSDAAEG